MIVESQEKFYQNMSNVINNKEDYEMSFIKKVGLYCFRKWLKMLILFLVMTIIATFMLTGIAICDAAKGATASEKRSKFRNGK